MKTYNAFILIFILFLLNSNIIKAGDIDILGIPTSIDTLEYKQVGPGVMYSRLSLPNYPLSFYMLTVDLNNNYNFIETSQTQNQLGKTEAMTTAFTRLSSENHRPIGSVNGNFWVVSGQNQPDELLGVPYSGSMKNGEMITMPSNWNRGRATTTEDLLQEIGFAVLDTNKKMWIDDMGFDGKVIIDGIGEYPISEINRIRDTDQIVFYNNFMGEVPTRSDDSGIEVFIKPKSNQSWQVNSDVECEVIDIIKDKGENTVQEGFSVLSGQGAGRTFLENLAIGQTVKVNMGIFTLQDTTQVPAKQMVTGNALVLKNGELTIRNTNETYNSQLYPRTGIGMSQDGKTLYLITIDKGNGSIGASTATMCGILNSCGAWNATSMDGGGSAQMMLRGNIVNNPSDGSERAVANCFVVYQNTPDDDTISKIEFEDYKVDIPSFASYKPVILAYNQYGALINEDLKDFTLTCDASLGTIKNDSIFVGSSSTANGLLTAHYKELSVSKPITVTASSISFKLDSVLIDQRREYPIEVQSTIESNTMEVDPSLLTWTIKNPEICVIDNGTLKGLKNGSTTVVGSLGDYSDSIKVYVEIPESNKILFDSISTDNWTFTSSSALNATISNFGLPTSWESGAAINFVYTATRAPFLKLTRNEPLFSLPDTIKIGINLKDISLSKAVLSLRANNSTNGITTEFTSLPNNIDTEISLPLADIFDTSDIAIYPVWFEYLNFYLGTQTLGQTYTLGIKDITLCYNGYDITYLPSVKISAYQVFPNPVKNEIYIIPNNDIVTPINVKLFDLSGKMIKNWDVNNTSEKIVLSMQGISSGTYLLKIQQNNNAFETVKIIKR